MLKHLVLLKLSEHLPEQTVNAIADGLADLKKTLPGIMSFSCGSYSGEGDRNKGYNYAFSMDFIDQEFLHEYLNHPKHLQVKKLILQALAEDDGMLVFDYEL